MIVIVIDTTWNVTPDIWYIYIWYDRIIFSFHSTRNIVVLRLPRCFNTPSWRVNLSCFCQALEKSSRATSIRGSPWWAPCFPIAKSWRKSWKSSGLWSSSFLHRKQIHQMAALFKLGMTGYVSKLGLTALRWSRKKSWLETSPFLWIIDATLGATHDIYVVP